MTQANPNFCHRFWIFIFIGFLSGCTSLENTDEPWWANSGSQSTTTVDSTRAIKDDSGQIEVIGQPRTNQLSGLDFEQRAALKSSPDKEELLLYAVSAYLAEPDLQRASQLLESIDPQELPQFLLLRQQVLYAALYLKQNNAGKSQQIIDSLAQDETDDPVFMEWMQLVKTEIALDDDNFLESLELLSRQPATSSDRVRDNQSQAIWLFINRQSLETLEQSRFSTSDPKLLGWIDLGIIEKTKSRISTDLWQRSIEFWSSTYRNHPAYEISRQLYSAPDSIHFDQSRPLAGSRIALLLPLSSAYGEIAQTISNGFLAAAEARGALVSLYDTGNGTTQILAKYQQALLSGAQVVVGPLGNAAVNHLAQANEIVKPTLLLGNLSADTQLTENSANAYTFSLDPENEAESLAMQAYNRGFNRIGILYPDSTRGRRLNSAFVNAWRELGGTVSSSIVYSTDLYQAAEPVERLLSAGVSNAGAIFLASNAQQGRLLSQYLLKQMPDITIFATSSIYSGQPEPTRDFVLNNVIFSDMPWMIEGFSQTQNLKQRLDVGEQSSSDSLSRYFAFGVDAYSIAEKLPGLMGLNTVRINGVTGTIVLRDDNFRINRPLIQFVQGVPRPIN